MQKIEKILFPSDLTSYSLPALEYALTFSKLYDAKLFILHIFNNSPYENLSRESSEMNELYSSVEENARIEMNRYIREKLGYNKNIIQALRCGNIQEEIIKFAEKEKINLIILEEYGKPAVFSLNQKDFTEKTFTKTSTPVLKMNETEKNIGRPLIKVNEDDYQFNTLNRTFFN